jgi:hypothetical protein
LVAVAVVKWVAPGEQVSSGHGFSRAARAEKGERL